MCAARTTPFFHPTARVADDASCHQKFITGENLIDVEKFSQLYLLDNNLGLRWVCFVMSGLIEIAPKHLGLKRYKVSVERAYKHLHKPSETTKLNLRNAKSFQNFTVAVSSSASIHSRVFLNGTNIWLRTHEIEYTPNIEEYKVAFISDIKAMKYSCPENSVLMDRMLGDERVNWPRQLTVKQLFEAGKLASSYKRSWTLNEDRMVLERLATLPDELRAEYEAVFQTLWR